MPVYRLTPVEGTERCPEWHASSMRPYCLWVRANDEAEARRQVALATSVDTVNDNVRAPWKSSELVSCECDTSKDVAPGVICVRKQPAVVPCRFDDRMSA